MTNTTIVDVAGYLPSDVTAAPDRWPVAAQRGGAHMTQYGFGAFSSHSHYPQATRVTVCDTEQRLHLSVWLRDGIDVAADGWTFRVEGRDTVAGYLPGAPWRTDFDGHAHHVGLLLAPEILHTLAGDQGDAFFERLRRDGFLRVRPGDAEVLRAAHELDAVLLAPSSSLLLREAKSLELLARMIEVDTRRGDAGLTQGERARLHQARERLLGNLAAAPTIEQLARACGMNTFQLKHGFKQLFGLPVYALYQRERMQAAWDLIATGRMTVTEAGDHLGYANMSHFGAAFRKVFGILPSELKRRTSVSVTRPLQKGGGPGVQ